MKVHYVLLFQLVGTYHRELGGILMIVVGICIVIYSILSLIRWNREADAQIHDSMMRWADRDELCDAMYLPMGIEKFFYLRRALAGIEILIGVGLVGVGSTMAFGIWPT